VVAAAGIEPDAVEAGLDERVVLIAALAVGPEVPREQAGVQPGSSRDRQVAQQLVAELRVLDVGSEKPPACFGEGADEEAAPAVHEVVDLPERAAQREDAAVVVVQRADLVIQAHLPQQALVVAPNAAEGVLEADGAEREKLVDE